MTEAYQLTLTSANTNYDLLALVRAISSTFVDDAEQITIQADKANAGDVLVGDANLSATRYGAILSAQNAFTMGGGNYKVHLKGVNARSSTAAQKVNVAVVR